MQILLHFILIKYFVLKLVILGIMTLYSVSWRFDSIPNVGTENRVGSSRLGSKIIGTESGFGSIPRVGTDGSGRFQYLEPKPDPTVSLIVKIVFYLLLRYIRNLLKITIILIFFIVLSFA